MDDVVEEQVGLGIDVGGNESGFEGGGAESCGVCDGDRAGVDGAGRGGGGSAVGGVANLGAGGGGGDGELERGGEHAAIDGEFGVGDKALRAVDVGGER